MAKQSQPGKKRNAEEQYINLPYVFIKSPAWRSLSGAAVRLWFELSLRFNGGNNGKLTLSFAEAADALNIGKATVQSAYKELEAKGFIVLERQGNWYGRRAHEWRLTTKPTETAKGRVAPTHDWREWKPPKKTKRGSGSEPSVRSVVPSQNPMQIHGSKSEPVKGKNRVS